MPDLDREWTQDELRQHLIDQGWKPENFREDEAIPQGVKYTRSEPLTAEDIAWVKELIANGKLEQRPGPYRISGLAKGQDPGAFMRFSLEGGGRVSIPPDQVMRMWNEEEERNAKKS